MVQGRSERCGGTLYREMIPAAPDRQYGVGSPKIRVWLLFGCRGNAHHTPPPSAADVDGERFNGSASSARGLRGQRTVADCGMRGAVAGQSLIGKVGSVVKAIRGGQLPGEVRVVIQGIPHYLLAYCGEPVASGADVLVIHNRGSRQIDVEPWNQSSDLDVER